MNVTEIREAGSSNVLQWAMKNGAEIWNEHNMPLHAFINDETFYLVTLSDLNFFQLFRLTQTYRDKLRILEEKPAAVPSKKELEEWFPGEYMTATGEHIKLSEAADLSINTFLNLAKQMMSDTDIISPSAVRLFLPMIARRFDVQIPLSFLDVLLFMSKEERQQVFTSDYPNTFKSLLGDSVSQLKINILLECVKSIHIVRYGEEYEKYLKIIKYAPLKTYSVKENLYAFGLLDMFKQDNVNRSEVKAALFKADKNKLSDTMRRLSNMNSDLKMNFVIQIPIQYMQILLNTYDNHTIPIDYESSMQNIVANGLVYDGFKTYDEVVSPEEENEDGRKEFINQVEAYRVRITEANQVLLNTINAMLSADITDPIDDVFAFSLLPGIYKCNAVCTINEKHIDALSMDASMLGTMFTEIKSVINGVRNDLTKQK